ncbi:flagellar hook-associated protein FlgL [Thalassotalea marina]|uniref:Flagellar hook-associated protein FlgL n=1 Tax=Thalassotalea marina TaxID=1673741 RepID=A0A919BCX1_9GAMM|nr:flagellar hook-associated protein FlgL [Thalassotalea marina]GHF80263.1 flagellar hook-associated protein FlgL [Thalassotalea marina]
MRISTAQFYYQNSQRLTDKQSNVNDQMKYISSGKRVLTAKDDAVSFGTLTGYKSEIENIEKYQRNITIGENRNSLIETSFGNAERILQELKTTFIQANNGTLSDSDLQALADIIKDGQDQLLDIANTKDETGGFIFSGFQIDVQPFSLQPDNSVSYNGDSGQRQLQVAKNILVDTNIPGDYAFEKVKNNLGDFSPTYNSNTSGIGVNKAVIATPGSYDPATNPPGYTFNFSSATDLTVTDDNGVTVYSTATYVPGQTVAFNGVEVQLNGNPLPGDNFTLDAEEEISIFDTIKSAIEWVEAGQSPANSTQHNVEYGEILDQINAALNHTVTQRTEAGVRLKLIENQDNNHQDALLNLEQGRSNIEDLDFAKAISTFEQSQVALQAAQQTFVQIKGLTLFNYI